jgi:DNA polymerase III alpha subunit
MARVDSRKVRANSIQALAASGAMKDFNIPRKLIFLYCSDYRKKMQVWLKKHDPTKETFTYPWPKELDWKLSELYALEQFYLGESFACKPPDAYDDFFKGSHKVIYDIKKAPDKTKLHPIKVIIRSFFEFKVKKEKSKFYGMSMIKAIVEDKNGDQCGLTIFPDGWKKVSDRLKQVAGKNSQFSVGLALSFSGTTNNYEDNIGIILDDLMAISSVPATPADLKAKKVNLKLGKKSEIPSESNKSLFEEMEDNLYDEGLLDLDDET